MSINTRRILRALGNSLKRADPFGRTLHVDSLGKHPKSVGATAVPAWGSRERPSLTKLGWRSGGPSCVRGPSSSLGDAFCNSF